MTDVGKWTKFRLNSKGYPIPLNCEVCGKLFKIGDRFIYKGKQNRGDPRYYHEKCWDTLFIDLPDLSPEELAELS